MQVRHSGQPGAAATGYPRPWRERRRADPLHTTTYGAERLRPEPARVVHQNRRHVWLSPRPGLKPCDSVAGNASCQFELSVSTSFDAFCSLNGFCIPQQAVEFFAKVRARTASRFRRSPVIPASTDVCRHIHSHWDRTDPHPAEWQEPPLSRHISTREWIATDCD